MIGDKSWWLDYLNKNPKFVVKEDKEEFNAYIQVTNKELLPPAGGLLHGPEKLLKDRLGQINLFPNCYFEEKVKLGKDTKQIDVLGRTEDSDWVIECKVEQNDRAALDIRAVGQAIGQVIILSYLHKIHYKQNLSRKIMPAIATWVLGSGSSVIKDICRLTGVTIVELLYSPPDDISGGVVGPSARIYFLNEKSLRTFCDDWSS